MADYFKYIPFTPSNYLGFYTKDDLVFSVKENLEGTDIVLFQNTAEVNRVDKTNYLTEVGTLSGVFRSECSLITPSVVFESDTVPSFNYVYIPAFNRYYHVVSITTVTQRLWRMNLNCDVLMSYKEGIKALSGVIARQELDFNPYLVDNQVDVKTDPIIETYTSTFTPFTVERETPLPDLPDLEKIKYPIVIQIAKEVDPI